MTKAEYLRRLRDCLAQMPAEEREVQLAYYEELFDDMLEDGMSEEEAALKLGSPESVAETLLTEMPMATLVRNRVKKEGRPKALTIALLILGAPLWLPLLIAFLAVLLALLITLWAVGLSVGVVLPAVGLSLLAAGGAALLGYVTLPLLYALGFLFGGGGTLILGVLLIAAIVRGLVLLCRWIWRGCKKAMLK
ncbi:MAG: DUF1700 domain-containing protein [Oscillospiraceae bacterium]|nr:DUF1700 domain-containing protein [Oscillospiraceae bacterium]